MNKMNQQRRYCFTLNQKKSFHEVLISLVLNRLFLCYESNLNDFKNLLNLYLISYIMRLFNQLDILDFPVDALKSPILQFVV